MGAWDSLTVQWAPNDAPSVESPTWVTLNADVEDVHVTRGRNSELQRFPASHATIQLDDPARDYDPFNGSGPYAGDLVPGKQVRIRATDSGASVRTIWRGYVDDDGWQWSYDDQGKKATATISCIDLLGRVAMVDLAELADQANSGDLPGTRAGRVLDEVSGIPAGLRSLDAGDTILQGTTYGANALDYLYRIAESEGGFVYVDKDGVLQLEERHAVLTESRMSSSQATWDDAGATLNYWGIKTKYAAEIRNLVRVNRDGGATQEVSDATSISAYGRKTLQLPNLLMLTDPDAYARAEWLVKQYKDPLAAPASFTFEATESSALGDQALQRELRDRVTVKFTPPGGGSQISHECFIDRIEHRIPIKTLPNYWEVTFGLSSAERFGFTAFSDYLELNHATRGKLNTGRLAF